MRLLEGGGWKQESQCAYSLAGIQDKEGHTAVQSASEMEVCVTFTIDGAKSGGNIQRTIRLFVLFQPNIMPEAI